MASVLAAKRQHTKMRVGMAAGGGPAPSSFFGRPHPVAGMSMVTDSSPRAAGGFARMHSRATDFEGRGGVGVREVTFLEGIEPQLEAVDAICVVSKSLRTGAAPTIFRPLPGVVTTAIERVAGVEEWTERYRHARTAPVVAHFEGELRVCRC